MNRRIYQVACWSTGILIGLCLLSSSANGQDESVELTPLRNLNSYFPFKPPQTLVEWEQRRAKLREHLLVSLGLWPKPDKRELRPTVHGLRDMGDYTIEKVYFNGRVGHVTGNLYKPKNIKGAVPGVLCPHGHHRDGRFRRASEKEIDEQIAKGAEKFRNNARSPLQARCAHLAKMGCVVFHYDMMGYADSQQIGYGVAHGLSQPRLQMDIDNQGFWGFFTAKAESFQQTIMGAQTLHSLEALDFLESLPEVDKKRIGVTGASGGGTQTFILCAIDDRPAVSFPAVMVSTAMQGGCPCENNCYLRTGTGNVEIAAMFAPKPMGLTTADDWTREMSTKGFPELQRLYQLYGKPDNVHLTDRLEFEHNYNQVSREAMYRWFKQHLGLQGPTEETEIEFVDPAELSVYDEQHPRPAGGDQVEKQILLQWSHDSSRQLKDRLFNERATPKDFDEMIGTYVDVVAGCAIATEGVWSSNGEAENEEKFGNYQVTRETFRNQHGGTASLTTVKNRGDQIVWLGPSWPMSEEDQQTAKRFLADGYQLLFFDNHTIRPEDQLKARRVNNQRAVLAYTLGYNAPQLARRANAWLNAVLERASVAKQRDRKTFIVADEPTSLELAVNASQLSQSNAIDGMVFDTGSFAFHTIQDIRHPNLLPGATKYFDLPGLIALTAPTPCLVIGKSAETGEVISRSFRAHQQEDALTLWPMVAGNKVEEIAKWIAEKK